MKVIGIETSGLVGSIAVCDGNTIVGKKTFGNTLSHDKEIVSSLNVVFEEIKWEPKDIDLIAVSVGPGSYTGLRIGITCAKTLAYGLGKPVIDVPTLDVLAEKVENDVKNFCPVIDAKRKIVYACIYAKNNNEKKRITDFLIISPYDLLDILPEPILLFGDGVQPYKEIFLQKKVVIANDGLGIADVVNVAKLGLKRYEQGKRCEINLLAPLYLRRSEAEERLEGNR
ncbi:MAG: tRNA (adenosine(37)-N6)-threonylcarbamoyltransferase complex dimerization subunit type 1 TsaB [Candidatus Scalinduaceae bacterium]